MPSDAMGLELPIGFSLEEAQLALQRLEQMAREAGKKIKKSGDDAGSGFSDSISKWRKEEKTEGRQVGFLVDQFTAGLVPATGAAREGVNLLTKAFVGGVGLSLAFDAAGAGVRLFVEWMEKEQKAQEAATESAEAHAKAISDLVLDTQAYARSVAGTTSSLEFLFSKRREFESANAKDIKRRDELDALVYDNERLGITTTNALMEEREILTKRIEVAQKKWNAAVEESFQTRRGWEQAAAAIKAEEEARADAKKRGEEKLKELQLAGNRVRLEADREGLTATQLVWAEFHQRRREILESDSLAQQAIVRSRNRKLLQIDQEYRDKITALATAQAQSEAEERAAVLMWEQEHYRKREAMAKEAALTIASYSAAGGNLEKASALSALATETEGKLKQIRVWEMESVIATQDAETLRTSITEQASEKRQEIMLGEATASRQLAAMGIDALKGLGNSMGSELRKSLSYSAAYSAALHRAGKSSADAADFSAANFARMVQDELATMGSRAAVQAAWEGAQALAALARYDYGSASAHGVAAAEYAGVAVLAGAGASIIGANRGMTKAERASLGGTSPTTADTIPTTPSGPREVGGTGGTNATTREVVILVADPFETPQEAAQRAVRRLDMAKDLGLTRAA